MKPAAPIVAKMAECRARLEFGQSDTFLFLKACLKILGKSTGSKKTNALK